MKRTLFLSALGLFFAVAFAVSTPTAMAQSCSFTTFPNGNACKKAGARCSPPTAGSGNVGNCTTAAAPKDTIVCECLGAPSPSYNLTLTLLTPGDLDTGTATSTITIIPFNGFTGAVNFTCAVSGMTHPGPTCATPPPATVTGPGSATSQLAVSVAGSTAQGTYRVAVAAVDSHGRPPDNGEQSSIVSVSRVYWTIGKSLLALGIALAAFLAVLTIWGLAQVWRGKRADPRELPCPHQDPGSCLRQAGTNRTWGSLPIAGIEAPVSEGGRYKSSNGRRARLAASRIACGRQRIVGGGRRYRCE